MHNLLCFICAKGVDVCGCGDAANGIVLESAMRRALLMIKIYNDHSDIIVKVAPYSFTNFLNVIVSHFSLLRGLLKGSSHQSLSYSLQGKNQQRCFVNTTPLQNCQNRALKIRGPWRILTALGFLKTISTAASSDNCSQRPSDAKIRNKSCGLSFLVSIEGSAVIAGRFKGMGFPNC